MNPLFGMSIALYKRREELERNEREERSETVVELFKGKISWHAGFFFLDTLLDLILEDRMQNYKRDFFFNAFVAFS